MCPAGEADWIPGWTAQVLHSDRKGYVSDQCIFRTDESNAEWGPGIWYFTEYDHKEGLTVLVNKTNWIMHPRVSFQQNLDGTVTGIWYFICSALNEKGNKELKKFEKNLALQKHALPITVEHYFTQGKKITRLAMLPKLIGAKFS
jgi:hypothetical protein